MALARQEKISELLKDIERYESFIRQLNLISGKYCSKHSDLVSQIAKLRLNLTDTNMPSVVSVFDSPLESVQDLQMSKKLWRKIAMLTHPDRGGDPLLFNYAHALYVSNDVSALSFLSECLMKNDFSSFVSSVRQKINALYEIAKAKPSYAILLADSVKDYKLAEKLAENALNESIKALKTLKTSKKYRKI